MKQKEDVLTLSVGGRAFHARRHRIDNCSFAEVVAVLESVCSVLFAHEINKYKATVLPPYHRNVQQSHSAIA